jgi:hypothetical protein
LPTILLSAPPPPPDDVIVLNTELFPGEPPAPPEVAENIAPLPPAPTVTVIADPDETDNPVLVL